jgi:hypothetical protein
MLLFIELGRQWAVRQVAKRGTSARSGVGVVDSAVYGLLALLLGFSFSGAAERFDHRRELIVQQINGIGTAWLRIELLPAESQPEIRHGFRRYLDALIATYAEAPGSVEELRQRSVLAHAEADLWGKAVAAVTAEGGEPARMLLLPSLNETFDTVDMDRLAQRVHPPIMIWIMLGVAALASAMFAGYGLASGPKRNWFHIIGVAATISMAVWVIVELESPRLGLIRIDSMDRALVELRETWE